MLMVTASIMVALALESSNLHRRIALSILKLVGGKPRWFVCWYSIISASLVWSYVGSSHIKAIKCVPCRLLFGFMFPTWFLSMWVSNTAATAMMLPITEAVMGHLETIARNCKSTLTVNNVCRPRHDSAPMFVSLYVQQIQTRKM